MLYMIVALDEKRAIGKNNDLPWHLKQDLAFFKQKTKNQTVLMGRKTFESIIAKLGKPLPQRNNLILTRKQDWIMEYSNCQIVNSSQDILNMHQDIFIIGGAEIYQLFLPYAAKMFLTRVHTIIEDADAFFPEFTGFKLTEKVSYDIQPNEKYAFSFESWERV